MENINQEIDVRQIPPQDKHAKILGALGELKSGEAIALINDHDPKPLYYQLTTEFSGMYEWTYIEEGPKVWRVAIKKN